jgi:hypothetical protein
VYHQCFIIHTRILIGLLARQDDKNNLQYPMTKSYDRFLVAPPYHKTLIEPLELTPRFAGAVGYFA